MAAAGLLAAAWLVLRPAAPTPARPGQAAARRGRTSAGADEIPRIDLARLDSLDKLEKIVAATGERDPGEYPSQPAPPHAPMPGPAPMPVATPAPGPPLPPALNMTYLGNLEKAGLKVAVFLTEKKIVLHGREGDVVGSRMRVVKIGLESVDVEDLTSGRGQRMALPKKGGSAEAAKDTKDTRDRDKEPGGNSR